MAYNTYGVIPPDKVWALLKALMNPRATKQDGFSSRTELLLALQAELSSLELVISCSLPCFCPITSFINTFSVRGLYQFLGYIFFSIV
jgi:hypothetical protein